MTGRSHALDLVPGLRELAQAQFGVVRRDQLAALGVTHAHVRQQVGSERWRTVGTSLVILQTGALRREQRVMAAQVLAADRGLLSGPTALEVAGLRGWARPLIHLRVERGCRPPRVDGVAVHSSSLLPPAQIVGNRWRCVPTAAAAVEAATYERSPRTAAGLLLAVAQQRISSPSLMLRELAALHRPRHAAVLRSALLDAGAGAESVAEADVVSLVRRAGLPEPRRQVLVSTAAGPVRLDLVLDLPDGRCLVIEVDGVHHDDPMQRARDNARDLALVQLGYIVVRISVLDMRAHPEAVLARLRGFAWAA